MTLGANQNYAEMQSEKIKWRTVDDSLDLDRQKDVVDFRYTAALSQQQIKQFLFEYTVDPNSQALFLQ